jgi:hypothetical protein
VVRMKRRKTLVMWLCDEKPTTKLMSAIDR